MTKNKLSSAGFSAEKSASEPLTKDKISPNNIPEDQKQFQMCVRWIE